MNIKKLLIITGLFASMAPAQSMCDIVYYAKEYAADTAKEAAEATRRAVEIAAISAAKKANSELTKLVTEEAAKFAQEEMAQIAAQKAAEATTSTVTTTVTSTVTETVIPQTKSWLSTGITAAWNGLCYAASKTYNTVEPIAVAAMGKTGQIIAENPKASLVTTVLLTYAAYEYKKTLELRAEGMKHLALYRHFDYNGIRLTDPRDIEALVWRVEIPAVPLSPIAITKTVWSAASRLFVPA